MLNDARDDLVPDPLSYEDFKSTKDDILGNVRARLIAGYSPSRLLHMDVPKNELTMRPGSIPVIEDRIAYTALIGSFAERVDGTLEDESVVPSYRVQSGRKKSLFKFGINQWFKFQELTRSHYDSGYRYLLVTDLTAYFDHINHELLIGQLRSTGVSEGALSLLATLLNHWSDGSPVGIPQGLDPSSLLGNVYLDPLDKYMIRHGYHYFRYVDDIRVFANSYSELQRAMVDIIHQTRILGLHVQTAKTRVVQGDEILELVNERQAELGAVDYHLDIGYLDVAEDGIRDILRDLMRQGRFNERHFRKCLNTLRKLDSPSAVRPTLQKLDELKPWAQSVSDYLTSFAAKPRLHQAPLDRFLDGQQTQRVRMARVLVRTHPQTGCDASASVP